MEKGVHRIRGESALFTGKYRRVSLRDRRRIPTKKPRLGCMWSKELSIRMFLYTRHKVGFKRRPDELALRCEPVA